MSPMGILNLYLILIVVLVIVLFVLVIVLIVFRDSFKYLCCSGCSRSRDSSTNSVPYGLRNPAFDDQEYPNRLSAIPEQRPFSVMETLESPPSYEEAVKQELFRFQMPLGSHRNRSPEITLPNERHSPTPRGPEDRYPSGSASESQRDEPQNLPSTSLGVSCSPRKRSSTTGSINTPHLSTISEEEFERDERPITVVIDNIGIQASRLVENCDTSVNINNGHELNSQSKC